MKPWQHFSRFFLDSISMFGRTNLLQTISLYLLPLVLLLSCNTDDIRDAEVPSMALNALYLEFPEAKKVQWEEEATGYQVTFENSGEVHKVLLDPEGNFLKFKKEIDFSELPQAVKSRISESYRSANRDEAAILKIDTLRYYQVELERFVINDRILFNEAGEVISGISF